jgi:hypothetical protein
MHVKEILRVLLLLALLSEGAAPVPAQVLIEGRVEAVVEAAAAVEGRAGGAGASLPPMPPLAMPAIFAIAALPGAESESLSFRTWETHPAGWFRLSGSAGRYTLAFSNPAHFLRPLVLTNQFLAGGESLDLRVRGAFDFACFGDAAWDTEPARCYWQLYTARGTGVTAVGFKLATDGVDGDGPGKQDVIVSIHRPVEGDPESWPQVGPAGRVLGVDCGGAKGYWHSAGWSSGEVPTTPGETYAVRLRPAAEQGSFQAFWRPRGGGARRLFRAGAAGTRERGFVDRDLWLAVSGDGDGLLIPYAKRVHREFHALTRFARRWSQTYVARGRGLAAVVLYAAVSGAQPPLARQRLRVRVRAGGPEGPVIGTEKIAAGNGNYTGDASWGSFVLAYAPGEVPLEPGATYALDFETIETLHTIGGFVNIKGEVSDGRAGFNPYRKCPPDDSPEGTAYYLGTEPVDYDLDLQVVEYAGAAPRWEEAVDGPELVANGAMEPESESGGKGAAWSAFALAAGTAHVWAREEGRGSFARLEAAPGAGAFDGGLVQGVRGLERAGTYRLRARVRATWPASVEREVRVGIDPSGQTEDPAAGSIEWTSLPGAHGEFVEFASRPVRPRRDAVSIWLRARSEKEDPRFPFRADLDDVSLRRVATGVPGS